MNDSTYLNKYLCFIFLLLFLVILRCGSKETTNPELSVVPTYIDLSTHQAGYLFSDSFIVKNAGSGILSGSISNSVSWLLVLSPRSFDLDQDEEIKINCSGIFPSTSDSFSTNICVSSNDDSQFVNIHGVVKDQNIATQDEISFSGYEWFVKSSSSPVGPGPNCFSNSTENVWVDNQGQLHLKITKRNGKWYCAEVVSKDSFGYGKYIFSLASRIDRLNENIVVGLFTWSDDPEYNHREIDIEFSRWEYPTNDNAQFVIQPWDKPGNIYRFNIQHLDKDKSTHSFNWRDNYISFLSIFGNSFEAFNYTGDYIPVPGNENARINFWLVWGNPPSDGLDAEVVLDKFEFVPSQVQTGIEKK